MAFTIETVSAAPQSRRRMEITMDSLPRMLVTGEPIHNPNLTETPRQIATRLALKWNVDATRTEKAIEIAERNHIDRLFNGNYQIASQNDANHFYQVNPREHTCNCQDYLKNHSSAIDQVFICKHQMAVMIHLEQTNWKVGVK